MWRISVIFPFIIITCGPLSAQTDRDMEAIVRFHGTDNAEDLDTYEVERLCDLMDRPLMINVATLSEMTSSGLLSRYQAASIVEYRQGHGDVLSFAELAALDGFGEETVRKLAPFISLYSYRIPGRGRADSIVVENDLSVKTGIRWNGSEPDFSYGMKYRVHVGEGLSLGLAASKSLSASAYAPDACSGFLACSFKRFPSKVVVGDFNARFGQGLALWNGMTMSGMTAPEAIVRNPSGISTSWSFTGSTSMTGVAAEVSLRRFNLCLMAASPGIKSGIQQDGFSLLPGLGLSWNGRVCRLGLTHYAEFTFRTSGTRIPDMKTAADMSYCIRGTDIVSEVAFDWVNRSVSALAGTVFPVGENLRLGTHLRYYPADYDASRSGAPRSGTGCSNEYGATLCGRFSAGEFIALNGKQGFGSTVRRHSGSFSVDFAYLPESKGDTAVSMQLKPVVSWDVLLSGSLKVKFRLAERLRTWGLASRTDLRADVQWQAERCCLNFRANVLKGISLGVAGYVEGGFSDNGLSVYARQGVFFIDNWDDRIYVYERDAPGSFNVPALYGRGVWTSVTGSWKFARWGRLYVRGSLTSYPFMKEKKPGRAELKLQYVSVF